MDPDRERLARGLDQLGITLPSPAHDRLIAFRDLLVRWNRVYNLTAVRDPGEMVARHLLDSLAVAPYLEGSSCLDVGTGAGLPGIPLALAAPDRRFTLLDSQAKRTRFLRQVVVELDIPNVEIVQSRVENYRPKRLFDIVISRAFAKISDFTHLAGPCCAPSGVLLAMKGTAEDSELSTLDDPWRIDSVRQLEVPGLVGERHLIILKRKVE